MWTSLVGSRRATGVPFTRDHVDSVVRSTKGAARRELAALENYTDLDNENSDEVSMGICLALWLAFVIWIGAVVGLRMTQTINSAANSASIHSAPYISMAEFKAKLGGRTVKEAFGPCLDQYGSVAADFTCFSRAARGISLNDDQTRAAFMHLDCDRDFRITDQEIYGALQRGSWACGGAEPVHQGGSAATPARDSEQAYFIDNSFLRADSPGLEWRASKTVDDILGNTYAGWGTIVRGRDSHDGWLDVEGRYLPFVLKGKPVVVRAAKVELGIDCRPEHACGPDERQRLTGDLSAVLASACHGGCTVDRVVIEAAEPGDTGRMFFSAWAAPSGSNAEELAETLGSGDAACRAIFERLVSGPFALAGCRVGNGANFDIARASEQLGPIDVKQYRSALGGHGATVAVQMFVQRVSASQFTADGARFLESQVVQMLSGVVSVQPDAIKDVSGNPHAVTIANAGGATGLLLKCKVDLGFGQTVATAAGVLTSADTKERLAGVLRALPEVKAATTGGDTSAADVRLGVAQSSDDTFFKADRNFDNRVSISEFESVAETMLQPPLSSDDARALFAALDDDGSNSLNDAEFYATWRSEAID